MKQIDNSFKRKLHRERFLGPSTGSIITKCTICVDDVKPIQN